MTSPNSATQSKRDLHVGGVGGATAPVAALTTMPANDALTEASETLLRKTAEFLGDAGRYIRDNPWAAIAAVGVVGLVAGIQLGRWRDAER